MSDERGVAATVDASSTGKRPREVEGSSSDAGSDDESVAGDDSGPIQRQRHLRLVRPLLAQPA
jgi:hypothetical protein